MAVATKMLSRLTPVDKPSPVAKITMNVIAMPSRAFGLLVKFNARMGPITSIAAMNMLRTDITRMRWRSWKYWILSGSFDGVAYIDESVAGTVYQMRADSL